MLTDVISALEEILAALDKEDLALPAAHISTAIDALRSEGNKRASAPPPSVALNISYNKKVQRT